MLPILRSAIQDPPNRVEGKAATLEKADLLGALARAPRCGAEALRPGRARSGDLSRSGLSRRARDLGGADPLRSEFVLDPCQSELPRERVCPRLRIAIVGEQFAVYELVQNERDLVTITGEARELPGELGAAVLALREPLEGALAQRGGWSGLRRLRLGGSGRCSRRARHAGLLTDLRFDLRGELRMFLQVLACVVLSLPDPVLLVGEPRA